MNHKDKLQLRFPSLISDSTVVEIADNAEPRATMMMTKLLRYSEMVSVAQITDGNGKVYIELTVDVPPDTIPSQIIEEIRDVLEERQ